jgi:triphosphoribosyl-dephospho-CoA synthase
MNHYDRDKATAVSQPCPSGAGAVVGPFTPGRLAQIACMLEVSARKPGNVHRFRDFEDSTYLDFLLSAAAIAEPMDRAREWGVGLTVLRAVEATRRIVETNTNLGMVLLLAPLAAIEGGKDLRQGVAEVVGAATVDDARYVYRAIRLARPGGLGRVPEQDVADEPTVTLLDAMRLAADRDLVARQYANGFADVFEVALPALRSALAGGRPLETAIVAAHLALLAERRDTLIGRKRGPAEADEASRRATEVLHAGWPDTPEGHDRWAAFDAWLRAEGSARNPGATADLITAALFIALGDGTITLPRTAGPRGWSGEPEDDSDVATSRYKVRVSKDYLVFCAAHFITYDGDHCERLHGHNYRAVVELEDDLDRNFYVFDFIALKDLTREIIDELDHRMLLPSRSDLITLEDDGPNVRVRYRGRFWSFPRDECVLLPVANTTAELLADYIAGRLRQAMLDRGLPLPRVVRVEVEESFGQSAEVEWRRDADSSGASRGVPGSG